MQNSKTLRLPKLAYYETYWYLIKAIIRIDLTDKEIEVLTAFTANSSDDHMFDMVARRAVRIGLGISHSNLSNIFKRLQEKGVMRKEDNEWRLHPKLVIDPAQMIFNINLINEDKNTVQGLEGTQQSRTNAEGVSVSDLSSDGEHQG